ncbi:MAG: quinolinate synthase NadA [Bacteroidia bacterium]|nr:quinolinate synthase NadA [Bacteroidia bacterium]
MSILLSETELQRQGYVHEAVDPRIDLFEAIQDLKARKNAVILAHYYQDSDIQDIADYIGDSLGLAQEAAKTKADMIVFAGVHFMAETAKLLNPGRKVVMPDFRAGCSLADSCPPEAFRQFREAHPGHVVISYINCTAAIKAQSDIICTSSNAIKVVESVAKDTPIIFAPDKNLGAWVQKKTGRNLVLWDGACMVHEIFSLEKITKLKAQHPEALFIAHPECEEAVLKLADFIGSTTGLLNFTRENSAKSFIVATESGILHQMAKASPDKTFIPAPPNNNCACNDCPHMKLNTLEKVYLCMKHEQPEVNIDPALFDAALRPLQRMLEISAK